MAKNGPSRIIEYCYFITSIQGISFGFRSSIAYTVLKRVRRIKYREQKSRMYQGNIPSHPRISCCISPNTGFINWCCLFRKHKFHPRTCFPKFRQKIFRVLNETYMVRFMLHDILGREIPIISRAILLFANGFMIIAKVE